MGSLDLIVFHNGEVQRVGGAPLVMINGQVHTYGAETVDEPYLKEWGWKCCVKDGTTELYKWLYRCMLEGLSVPKRTVEVGGSAEFEFVTEGTKADIDKITEDIKARKGKEGEYICARVLSEKDVTFMLIPMVQFEIKDEDENVLYTICQRVMMDNPLLMFPFFPSEPAAPAEAGWDKVNASFAIIKLENGPCNYIYSVVPTQEKRAQAVDVCKHQIGEIVKKVEEVYGIKPGDDLVAEAEARGLSEELMVAKVLKVIHDWIVLHATYSASKGTARQDGWWLMTPYSIYDHRYQGNCSSYTMAFCAAARLYGIEAINMTGRGYVNKDNSTDGSHELRDEHAWVAVRLKEYAEHPYGDYPADAKLWSCIDVYWDEPEHEEKIGLPPVEGAEVIWKYFLNMENINILSGGESTTKHSYRITDANIAYGKLPFGDNKPTLTLAYSGSKEYEWEVE